MSKIALVTGCSSGIGLQTAIDLAKNGYTTYATMRNIDKKNKLEVGAQKANVKLNIVQLDVSDDNSVSKVIDQIKNEHQRIDVLVNNAGYGLFGSIEGTSIEEFKEQIDTDFFGAVRTTKKILPIMREQGEGFIINISSVAGFMGFPIVPAYVCSKFALEGFTECLRHELYEKNSDKQIHAVLIEPGVVNTSFYDNMKVAKDARNVPKHKEMLDGMMAAGAQLFENAMGPEEVSKKILRVLNEENPEPRYRVGNDSNQYWADRSVKTPLEFEATIRGMLEMMTDQKPE
jgi:short-subunit dehydrogenase|tara:strand:+ start:470 stop:1333 length:864 start_codon:yes stop_codon:yes gene_type:complete